MEQIEIKTVRIRIDGTVDIERRVVEVKGAVEISAGDEPNYVAYAIFIREVGKDEFVPFMAGAFPGLSPEEMAKQLPVKLFKRGNW